LLRRADGVEEVAATESISGRTVRRTPYIDENETGGIGLGGLRDPEHGDHRRDADRDPERGQRRPRAPHPQPQGPRAQDIRRRQPRAS
jgi:hypothetical protein